MTLIEEKSKLRDEDSSKESVLNLNLRMPPPVSPPAANPAAAVPVAFTEPLSVPLPPPPSASELSLLSRLQSVEDVDYVSQPTAQEESRRDTSAAMSPPSPSSVPSSISTLHHVHFNLPAASPLQRINSIESTGTPLQRSESVERRRQDMEKNNFYIRKQLQDSPLCRRLIQFAEENSMLINAVLRQNIKLLKSSLLPMLVVPSCRRHLDFKVKRTYLKHQLRHLARLAEDEDIDDDDNDDDSEDYDDELHLEIERTDVLQSSFNALNHLKVNPHS